MTREERIDWLCRLRSYINVYMPKNWVAHMETALSEAIDREENDALEVRLAADNLIMRNHIEKLRDYEAEKGYMIEMKIRSGFWP